MSKVRQIRERRQVLANSLVDTLHDIEKQSGIFLIKPIYSYRGRESSEYFSKSNRAGRSKSAKRSSLNIQTDTAGYEQQQQYLKSKSETQFEPNWNVNIFVTCYRTNLIFYF